MRRGARDAQAALRTTDPAQARGRKATKPAAPTEFSMADARRFVTELAARRNSPRRLGAPTTMTRTRTCAAPSCGQPLTGKRRQAQYCDEACKQLAYRRRKTHETVAVEHDLITAQARSLSLVGRYVGFFASRGVSKEISDGRPYWPYSADNPESIALVRELYADLVQNGANPGATARTVNKAKAQSGFLIIRHTPPRLGLPKIYPEMKP